ncbi:unnamed protein product [Ixodes pacificus]
MPSKRKRMGCPPDGLHTTTGDEVSRFDESEFCDNSKAATHQRPSQYCPCPSIRMEEPGRVFHARQCSHPRQTFCNRTVSKTCPPFQKRNEKCDLDIVSPQATLVLKYLQRYGRQYGILGFEDCLPTIEYMELVYEWLTLHYIESSTSSAGIL